MLTIINKSTLVTDDEVKLMTRACAAQLRYHAAPLYGLTPVPVVFLSDRATAPPGSWVIAVLDDADQANNLGWHTEDQGDLIYGRVFARPVLDNGGDALTRSLSVASVMSHEVLETFCDPRCNMWADTGSGVAVAYEACDPVESDSYVINQMNASRKVIPVTVSNFVTPLWFDSNAAANEKFDWMDHVKRPFTMTPGGYVVTMREGRVSQQFGEHYPDWRKATKLSDVSRTARRSDHN